MNNTVFRSQTFFWEVGVSAAQTQTFFKQLQIILEGLNTHCLTPSNSMYLVFRPFLKSSLPKTHVGHFAAFLVWFEVLFAFDGTKFVFKNFFGTLGIGRNIVELMKNSYFNSNKSDHQTHWLSEWTSIATATKDVFQLVPTIRPEKKTCFYNGPVCPYFLRRPLKFHEISKSYLKLLSSVNRSCDLRTRAIITQFFVLFIPPTYLFFKRLSRAVGRYENPMGWGVVMW